LVPADPGMDARFTLVLKQPGALRRMMLPPNELALGETYLDDDWDLEGDILAAMRLGDVFEDVALGVGDLVGLARQLMSLPKERGMDGHDGTGRQRADLAG
ncbi:MAG: hypothetical protein M1380_09875, partial [Chloroflexi bacterium]|nr:hypothetical protein [Chloroflexota bacterium]